MKQVLKVSLFNYIPDIEGFKGKELLKQLEEAFEKKYPEIDLELMFPKIDIYDQKEVENIFLNYEFDLVELDAVIASQLSKEFIASWSQDYMKNYKWHTAAKDAAVYNDFILGIPHWLCSDFIYSYDKIVEEITDLKDLINSSKNMPIAAKGLNPSYDMVNLYIEAWNIQYSEKDIKNAIKIIKNEFFFDKTVMEYEKLFYKHCNSLHNKVNLCLDDSVDVVKEFIDGNILFLVGYSELLNDIISRGQRSVYMNTLSFGKIKPLVFSDLILKHKKCEAIEKCKDAADKFISFFLSEEVYHKFMMNIDLENHTVPRYLIPAISEFQISSNDYYYERINALLESAVSIPNELINKIDHENITNREIMYHTIKFEVEKEILI